MILFIYMLNIHIILLILCCHWWRHNCLFQGPKGSRGYPGFPVCVFCHVSVLFLRHFVYGILWRNGTIPSCNPLIVTKSVFTQVFLFKLFLTLAGQCCIMSLWCLNEKLWGRVVSTLSTRCPPCVLSCSFEILSTIIKSSFWGCYFHWVVFCLYTFFVILLAQWMACVSTI